MLNGVAPKNIPQGTEIIDHSEINTGHSKGLEVCRRWINNHHPNSHILILDSDAFPIKLNWFEIITGLMNRYEKKIAAPVRFENLDLFPHPCAMLLAPNTINESWFSFADDLPSKNLIGHDVSDVGSGMTDCLPKILPLLRSNAINPHPIACGIYQDCFYHHGAGSRDLRFRSVNRFNYLEGWPTIGEITAQDLEQLIFNNTTETIDNLRGTSGKFLEILMKSQSPR